MPRSMGYNKLKPTYTIVRKRRVYSKKSKIPLPVKKYVDRALDRRIETKTVSVSSQDQFGSILENATMNMYPILPYVGYLTIPQGVTQGTRTGNECKIRKVMLNYTLRPQIWDSVSNPFPNPFHVQLYLGNVKQYRGILPAASDVNLLYQLGAGTVAPTGALTDMTLEINTDNWDIKKAWTHNIGYALNNASGTQPAGQFFANNDFNLNVVQRLDITKLCASTLKFNDGSATHQGANLFFFYQAISASGSIFPATTRVCTIDFSITIEFEDA